MCVKIWLWEGRNKEVRGERHVYLKSMGGMGMEWTYGYGTLRVTSVSFFIFDVYFLIFNFNFVMQKSIRFSFSYPYYYYKGNNGFSKFHNCTPSLLNSIVDLSCSCGVGTWNVPQGAMRLCERLVKGATQLKVTDSQSQRPLLHHQHSNFRVSFCLFLSLIFSF